MKQQSFDLRAFSSAVKKYRSVLNIGLRMAAKQIGISSATLCRIENKGIPEINTACTICEWMNIPITNFIKPKK